MEFMQKMAESMNEMKDSMASVEKKVAHVQKQSARNEKENVPPLISSNVANFVPMSPEVVEALRAEAALNERQRMEAALGDFQAQLESERIDKLWKSPRRKLVWSPKGRDKRWNWKRPERSCWPTRRRARGIEKLLSPSRSITQVSFGRNVQQRHNPTLVTKSR
ncbi:hypothetical protein PF001_g26992 [Phytophthora fragariae]|uniref:Uncharacterized protein n=1 Tax=Phytophthora fragariae TaxID=53985 RepID=A0A6A3DPX2_9STRA|nr:hypothetical protein PF003_g14355 [Phytophthora fragariae]KAE8919958.1 hypothetical protein PF009_g29742 [Phytophthora fragariae]KAE9072051.1 hypothetical protein PF006_g29015 [Phytophthora fragariae]KAE9169122.1 hypothetical protein PF004_g28288 [Phytophthora fragariae]KAE9274594.1 hypothetical protein PF001_g26992 [Phytophthora fragariae]